MKISVPRVGFVCFVVMALLDSSMAQTITWTGGGDGTSWHDLRNWYPLRLPVVSDDVWIPDVAATTEIVHHIYPPISLVNSIDCDEDFWLTDGTLDVAAESTFNGSFSLLGGHLQGAGNISFFGLFEWEDGSMDGPGVLNLYGGCELSGSSAKTSNRDIENWVSTTLMGTGLFYLGATFVNRGAAVFHLLDNCWVTFFSSIGSFDNQGLLKRSGGTGLAGVAVPMTCTGDIEILSGSLELAYDATISGTISGAGTLRLSNGLKTFDWTSSVTVTHVEFASGTTNFYGTYNLAGSGSTTVEAGDHIFFPQSTVTHVGSPLTIQGGSITFDSGDSLTLSLVTQSGGSLLGTSDLTINSTTLWSGGTHGGTGTTTNQGSIVVTDADDKTLNRDLINANTFVWTGSGDLLIDSDVTNEAGASFVFSSDAAMGWTTSPGTFVNYGTFRKSSGLGTTQIQIPFENSGLVDLESGEVEFENDFVQLSGTTRLDDGDLLALTTVDIQAGTLEGYGLVECGNLVNGGRISPGLSAGLLLIDGNFDHSGAINIEIGGLTVTEIDQLDIMGHAVLNGQLNIGLIDHFSPEIGDTFEVVLFDSRTGDFNGWTGTRLRSGLFLEPIWESGRLILETTCRAAITRRSRRICSLGYGVNLRTPDCGPGCTYFWSLVSGPPAGGTFDDPTAWETEFHPQDWGTYVIQVEVTNPPDITTDQITLFARDSDVDGQPGSGFEDWNFQMSHWLDDATVFPQLDIDDSNTLDIRDMVLSVVCYHSPAKAQ